MHALIDDAEHPQARAARIGRGESGFVLVLTLLVLAVLIALVGAVGVSSVDVGNTSSQVTLRDRAYAVADAGIQTALFRLNTAGATGASGGTLTTGAAYSYTVAALSQGSSCAGLWAEQTSGSGQAVQQDCITSTGTVGSYIVKVQDRVVGYVPVANPFPVNGLLAINSFTVGRFFTGVGDIGSNGQISFGGGASVTGNLEYPKTDPPTGITCTTPCNAVPDTNPIVLPPSPLTAPAAYAAAAASNKDSTISVGTWSADDFTYTPATQQITGGNGNASPVTFQPGVYYYCDFSADSTNGVELDAAASATASNPVIIYVDSPSRSGSSCASGTGNFGGGKNNMVLNNLSGIGGAFQIYAYGTLGCTTTCPQILSKNNGTYTDVDIYAPNSAYSDKNNSSLTGDFVIGSFSEDQNSSFTFQGPSSGSFGGTSLSSYFPAAQQICTTGTNC